jgi:hypothetical protein
MRSLNLCPLFWILSLQKLPTVGRMNNDQPQSAVQVTRRTQSAARTREFNVAPIARMRVCASAPKREARLQCSERAFPGSECPHSVGMIWAYRTRSPRHIVCRPAVSMIRGFLLVRVFPWVA